MKNYKILLPCLALFVLFGSVTGADAQALEAQLISSNSAPSGVKGRVRYIEREVLDLINRERLANSLSPLTWNPRAAEVARIHSKDMGWQKYFNHRGIDGKMVNDRADSTGLQDWQMIGENIALVGGYEDPVDHVVKGWMLSPGHRKNILDDRWKETGIGIYITSEGTYYFTQVFLLRK